MQQAVDAALDDLALLKRQVEGIVEKLQGHSSHPAMGRRPTMQRLGSTRSVTAAANSRGVAAFARNGTGGTLPRLSVSDQHLGISDSALSAKGSMLITTTGRWQPSALNRRRSQSRPIRPDSRSLPEEPSGVFSIGLFGSSDPNMSPNMSDAGSPDTSAEPSQSRVYQRGVGLFSSSDPNMSDVGSPDTSAAPLDLSDPSSASLTEHRDLSSVSLAELGETSEQFEESVGQRRLLDAEALEVVSGRGADIRRLESTGTVASFASDWRRTLTGSTESQYPSLDESAFARSSRQTFMRSNAAAIDVNGYATHMIDPKSMVRVLWDLLVGAVVIIDFVIVPGLISFPGQHHAMNSLDAWTIWLSVFFTVDIVANFRTALESDDGGELVLDSRAVIIHYLKGPFLIDVAATMPWDLLVGNRGLVVIRLLRFLKYRKLREVAYLIEDNVGEATMMFWTFFELGFFIAMVIHYFACFIALIGSLGRDDAESPQITYSLAGTEPVLFNWGWQKRYGIDEMGPWVRYLMALSWSCSLVTGSETEFTPGTVNERITVGVLAYVSFVISAGITGLIVSAIDEIQSERRAQLGKMKEAKKAMKKLNVPAPLRRKVNRYLAYVARVKKGRSADTAAWLGDLSPYMQEEVNSCICESVLLLHPFFNSVHEVNRRAFCYLSTFTETAVYAPGDVVLLETDLTNSIDPTKDLALITEEMRSAAEYMYFLTSGKVRVITQSSERIKESPFWFGERNVFRSMTPKAREVIAFTYVEVFRVDAQAVVDVTKMDGSIANAFDHYSLAQTQPVLRRHNSAQPKRRTARGTILSPLNVRANASLFTSR